MHTSGLFHGRRLKELEFYSELGFRRGNTQGGVRLGWKVCRARVPIYG